MKSKWSKDKITFINLYDLYNKYVNNQRCNSIIYLLNEFGKHPLLGRHEICNPIFDKQSQVYLYI